MPVLSFLAAAAFIPGLAGAGYVARWAVVLIGIGAALCWTRIRVGPAHLIGTAFLAWAALSIRWTVVPDDGWNELICLGAVTGGAFVLAHERSDVAGVCRWMGLGLWLSSAIGIAQWLGYHPVVDIPALIRPAGLFVNPNLMAEVAVPVAIGLVATRQWWVLVGVLPAALLPQSRGPLLAAAAVALWAGVTYRPRVALAVAPLIGLVAFWLAPAKWVDVGSLHEHLSMWTDTLRAFTFWGHGLGSFYVEFPRYAVDTATNYVRPDHAHNDFLELAFELGVPGIAFGMAFLVCVLASGSEAEGMVLGALLVEACFAFPFHEPATTFLLGAVAGCAARHGHLVRRVERPGGLAFHGGT